MLQLWDQITGRFQSGLIYYLLYLKEKNFKTWLTKFYIFITWYAFLEKEKT